MAKIGYFDCFSGCSGDMILGALMDCGLPLETLKNSLQNLAVSGYYLSIERVKRAAVTATKFTVTVDSPQPERSLPDILRIINESMLPDKLKNKGIAIFQRLAEVEAKIHGTLPDSIHFHELGGVDSIVDIIGTLIGCDILNLERLYASPLPLGSGKVATSHGILPVPAPATLQLLALAHAPLVEAADIPQAELVTPTGAVLLTSLATFARPAMVLGNIGYGAGGRDLGNWPNILRLWVGEDIDVTESAGLVLLETNIDDMNPQIYGYLMTKLFAQAAADVWFTPIQMKKDRPAVMLSVLAPPQVEAALTEIIMKETSTLGIRTRPVSRHVSKREVVEFDSSLGHARVKVKRFQGEVVNIAPEYEDCRCIALEHKLPLQEVYRIIEMEAWQKMLTKNL